MPLTPGTRLREFEILDSLGAGGMGEVYRARDTKLVAKSRSKFFTRNCPRTGSAATGSSGRRSYSHH